MEKRDSYFSKKLTYLSMISMLAVVFIHAYNYTDSFLQPDTCITEGLHIGACIQFLISNALARFAVPLFFAISGFLFFNGKAFNAATYITQLKKRCRSVLSVFLIFSVLSFVVCYIIFQFTGPGKNYMIDERLIYLEKGFIGWLYPLLQNPFAFQLWFLAQLFILAVFSPVVYFLVKHLKAVALVGLFCVWFLNLNLNIGTYTLFNCDGYMFFTLGAYLAVNKISFPGKDQKIEKKFVSVIAISVWLLLCIGYTLLCATTTEPVLLQLILYKLCGIVGIVALWTGYDRISQKLLATPFVDTLAKNNFMVFLLHEPMMHIIYMAVLLYTKADAVHMLLYFGLPIVMVIATAYFGKLLRAKTPKLSSILTGGR